MKGIWDPGITNLFFVEVLDRCCDFKNLRFVYKMFEKILSCDPGIAKLSQDFGTYSNSETNKFDNLFLTGFSVANRHESWTFCELFVVSGNLFSVKCLEFKFDCNALVFKEMPLWDSVSSNQSPDVEVAGFIAN